MNRPPIKYDVAFAERATSRAHFVTRDTLALAEKLAKDPDQEARLERHRCLPCHYIPRVAGAAMTFSSCPFCGDRITSGSTNIDALCVPCAKRERLCAHCGGDIGMSLRRRKWPQATEDPASPPSEPS